MRRVCPQFSVVASLGSEQDLTERLDCAGIQILNGASDAEMPHRIWQQHRVSQVKTEEQWTSWSGWSSIFDRVIAAWSYLLVILESIHMAVADPTMHIFWR
jgi:hypothetical protein